MTVPIQTKCFDCCHLIPLKYFGTRCGHPEGHDLFQEAEDWPEHCPYFHSRHNPLREIDRNYTLGD